MDNLEVEINRRFDDIKNVTKLKFVVNPFTATADELAEIGNKGQEELIEIQVNMNAKRHLEKFGYIDFWISQGRKLAPTLAT